jgi:hypothetical protein
MRAPNDPILNDLAKEVGETKFDDACLDEFSKFNSGLPLRNCYPNAGARTNDVILFLGGRRQRIGVFDAGALYHASRFANMATHYFWKYRKKQRPINDADLIYSVAQAKSDMEFYLGAALTLNRIEGHLIESGILKVGAEAEADKFVIDTRNLFRRHARAWAQYVKSFKRLEPSLLGPQAKQLAGLLNEESEKISRLIFTVNRTPPNK